MSTLASWSLSFKFWATATRLPNPYIILFEIPDICMNPPWNPYVRLTAPDKIEWSGGLLKAFKRF